ncbi:hypothetical protein F5Y06DRAFT_203957 [Hypoxylon sp. FL0890]|nr:hypothetical protein F5Y06DRAFT_203957 [Hypoxylon sp. FL0890]
MTPSQGTPAQLSNGLQSDIAWDTHFPFPPNHDHVSSPEKPTRGPEPSAPSAESRARQIHFDVDRQAKHPRCITRTYQTQRGRPVERNGPSRFRPPSPYPEPFDKSAPNTSTVETMNRHVKFAQSCRQDRLKKDRPSVRRPPSPYPGRGATKLEAKSGSRLIHDVLPAANNEDDEYDAEIHSRLSDLILTKDELVSKVKLRRWMHRTRPDDCRALQELVTKSEC